MPSELATDIVNKIFADDKAGAIDAVADGLNAQSYDLVQQKRLSLQNNGDLIPTILLRQ